MFPVLAEQEIHVIAQRNQQNLAASERNREIRSLVTAPEASPPVLRSLPRAWTRLHGAVTTFLHIGHRPIKTGAGRAAAQS
jgi:hypothetical protein